MIASDPTANGRLHESYRSSSSDSPKFGEEPSFNPHESAPPETADPFAPLFIHLSELREFAGLYCSARIDQWRVTARGLALKAAFGFMAALFGATALIVAAALFVNGLATGIGLLCRGNIWLGQILVGGLLMLVAFVGIVAAMRSSQAIELRRIIDKYETRKRRERTTYGTDVAERAAEYGPE